jgi:hypothetical protein
MPHILQVGIKTALGLYIGMADQMANLGLFAAHFTLFGHRILRNKPGNARQNIYNCG